MNKKKKNIMLIPDTMDWILGTWANEIKRWNSDKYNFVIFPLNRLKDDKNIFLSLVKNSIDIVHCLSQTGYSQIKKILENNEISDIPTISSIWHITDTSFVRLNKQADLIVVMCKMYFEHFIKSSILCKKIRSISCYRTRLAEYSQ